MGDSNLADLFTAEEVELLVCGNKVCNYKWVCQMGVALFFIVIGMGLQHIGREHSV